MLKAWRKTQAANRLRSGWARQEHDWVCTYPSGKPLDPNDLSKSFHQLVQMLDLPKLRFHDLRHTHATHLLKAGVNPKVVQERLGHASAGFTLNVYAQVMPGMQREAAEAVERLLRTR